MVSGDMVSNCNIVSYYFIMSQHLKFGLCRGEVIFLYFGGALGRRNL